MKEPIAIALALLLLPGCSTHVIEYPCRSPDGQVHTCAKTEQRFDSAKFGQALVVGVAAGLVGAAAAHSYRRPYYYNRWYAPPVIVPVPIVVPSQERVIVEHRHPKVTNQTEQGATTDSRSADDEYNERIWKEQAAFGN